MKEIIIKGVDEVIYEDNSLYNMPVYMWKNEKLNGFYISLCVNYGSLDTQFIYKNKEYKVPNGIAHFMEHIKFNEKKGLKAHDYFDKLGSDINAFTTFEYTNYEVWSYDHFKENLSHLISYVLNPYFTSSIINKERGIITEEIKMDKDNPYSKLFYRNLNNLFKKSNYRYCVAGEIEDIKKIKLSDIKLIYEAFYHPENMFLVITGNINPYESMQIINDTLKELDIPKYNKPTKIIKKEPLKIVKKEDIYTDNVLTPKTKISYKIPLKVFKGLSKEKIYTYTGLLFGCSFGSTSDFNEKLYADNLVTSFNTSRNILDDYLIVSFNYESNTPDVVKERVLNQIKNLEIDPKFLARTTKGDIANMVLAFDSISSINSSIQSDLIDYGKIIDNYKEIYENITVKDIEKIIKCFDTDNYVITSVRPQ